MPAPLVTGAAGFAGGHLLDHLLQVEPRVVAWERPAGQPPARDGRPDRVTWRTVDVTEPDAVARALDEDPPSIVFHCAGVAAVAGASRDSAGALRVNAMGTRVLLRELARARGRIRALVTGSALVYRASAEPLAEDAPLGPSTPYGVTKLAQEMIAAGAIGLDVVVTRSFNHAGPRQGDEFVTSSFARQIAEAEAGLREPLIRVGNLDARRDIMDVRDTVRAYRLLAARGTPGIPYNVCRGEAHRIGDLLQTLVSQARVPIRIEVDPARLRPSDNPVVLGSCARLHADTGWVAEIPIDRTLTDILEYWRGVVRAPESTASL